MIRFTLVAAALVAMPTIAGCQIDDGVEPSAMTLNDDTDDARRKKRKQDDGESGGTNNDDGPTIIVDPNLPDGINAQFGYEQRREGVMTVLNPQWVEDKDVDTIDDHIDEIIEEDLDAVIRVKPGAPESSVEHEEIHHDHSQTAEGKRRLAIMLAGAELDPDHTADALGYDIFTELVAYAHDGNPNIAPAVNDIDEWVTGDDWGSDKDKEILDTNGRNFVDYMFPTVAGHYVDDDGDVQPPDDDTRTEAGRVVAALIIKYGLKKP